jgi:hypothetical protein
MRNWLALAALLPIAAAAPAQAPMKGLATNEIASVARSRTIDLRVSEQQGYSRPLPLMRGFTVQQGVAPNAVVGVGLSNIYGRGKSISNLRVSNRPVHSRKPAVTFILKF